MPSSHHSSSHSSSPHSPPISPPPQTLTTILLYAMLISYPTVMSALSWALGVVSDRVSTLTPPSHTTTPPSSTTNNLLNTVCKTAGYTTYVPSPTYLSLGSCTSSPHNNSSPPFPDLHPKTLLLLLTLSLLTLRIAIMLYNIPSIATDHSVRSMIKRNRSVVNLPLSQLTNVPSTSPPPPTSTIVQSAIISTTIFRLTFSLSLTIFTYLALRNSNFWPSYLGGTGLTINAWDISSTTSSILPPPSNQAGSEYHRGVTLAFAYQGCYFIQSLAFALICRPFNAPDAACRPLNGDKVPRKENGNEGTAGGWMGRTMGCMLLVTTQALEGTRRIGVVGIWIVNAGNVIKCLKTLSNRMGWLRDRSRYNLFWISAYGFVRILVFGYVVGGSF
eukprot:CAMPEP_0118651162 /NCGR_PEP_ID=MMETSP0785-20121206/10640_1 /TAXON_ID=91992 /ORGANISM="Bolidomonas pacifica, Strain CCMP 1866" /LENGTH=387 /DNA_ID=CAMNT_0006543599 /DNA_START=105 /DNA_END=1265 /DNA_ORIENTATION=+